MQMEALFSKSSFVQACKSSVISVLCIVVLLLIILFLAPQQVSDLFVYILSFISELAHLTFYFLQCV